MIECPKSVIKAGALLVKVRHGVKGPADARLVGLVHEDAAWMSFAFSECREAIEAAMVDLRQHGIMEMEWGPGLLHFTKAHRAYIDDDFYEAWARMLCAHDCFRQVIDKYGIANPTNDQIKEVIAYGNWR